MPGLVDGQSDEDGTSSPGRTVQQQQQQQQEEEEEEQGEEEELFVFGPHSIHEELGRVQSEGLRRQRRRQRRQAPAQGAGRGSRPAQRRTSGSGGGAAAAEAAASPPAQPPAFSYGRRNAVFRPPAATQGGGGAGPAAIHGAATGSGSSSSQVPGAAVWKPPAIGPDVRQLLHDEQYMRALLGSLPGVDALAVCIQHTWRHMKLSSGGTVAGQQARGGGLAGAPP